MTTTVSDKNQVTIPPDIAREFDIHPGTRLDWAKGGDGIITVKPLRNRGARAGELLGAGRHWLTPGSDPIADLLRERENDDRLDQVDENR